jgi:hypothetical protein
MRDEFPEFYTPTKEQFDHLWKNCTFSFDANTLLNVYSFSDKTLGVFLSLLDQFKERLWLTHQAAYEYHKNRPARISAQSRAIFADEFMKNLSEAKSALSNRHHPIIDLQKLSETLTSLQGQIANQNDKALSESYLLRCDRSTETIANLFEKKVGAKYSESDLEMKMQEKARKDTRLSNLPDSWTGKKKAKH